MTHKSLETSVICLLNKLKVHTSVCLSSSSLYVVFITMAEDIQNLLILHQMPITIQYDYTMIIWKFPKNLTSLYSRRENVVETLWGRRAVAMQVEELVG